MTVGTVNPSSAWFDTTREASQWALGRTPPPVPFVGRCKQCKAAHYVELQPRNYIVKGGRGGAWANAAPAGTATTIDCPCGARVECRKVKGVRTETPCGDKCLSATGPVCECSCAGRNHGTNNR